MATPPSRRTVRGTAETAPTVNTPPSKIPSFIEPKSDFLRHALDARRARDTPPTPTPASAPAPAAPVQANGPRRSASVASTRDPWIEHAASEEETAAKTAIRRTRRPSESAISHLPRMPTHRELESQSETLKQTIYDLNLKLQLAREQTNKLKDALEAAHEQIAELQPYAEQNRDLKEENSELLRTKHDLEQALAEKCDESAEILRIQDATVTQIEQHHVALEEAADVIIQSEKTNAELREENTRLNAELAHARSSTSSGSCYSTASLEDSPQKGPIRIYSIDESRPSTSHFDSDYFSQPASPHVKPKHPSGEKLAFSERARHFLELNVNGRNSVQELKKRVSDISVKKNRSPEERSPPVPTIPEDTPRMEEPKFIKRTTPSRRAPTLQPSPLDTGGRMVHRSAPTTPKTPTGGKDGLRALFRNGNPVSNHSISSSHPHPQSQQSSAAAKTSRASEPELHTGPFSPPPRQSSRQAQTTHPSSSSNERLVPVETWVRSRATDVDYASELSVPPPPESVITDVPSTVDPHDRWWKDLDGYPNTLERGRGKGNVNVSGGGGRERSTRNQDAAIALASRATQPSLGGDFLFNMAEDEDAFIQRAKGSLRGRR
jgi:hypothetical protein